MRLVDVVKRYGRRLVLNRVSLSVGRGSVTVVVGPNGAGKTTLLRVIAGLAEPDEGEVWLNGRLVYGRGVRVPPERRGVGYVPQDPTLFPHMSVYENIAFGLRVRGLGDDYVRERVEAVARLLGIEDLLDRPAAVLSGGEAQRVAIARALALKPPVLLMDEPLSHVDPWSRDDVRRVIREAAKSEGCAVIVTTHDMADLDIADECYALVGGVLRRFEPRGAER